MKKILAGVVGVAAVLMAQGSTMATRKYVDNSIKDRVPYTLSSLAGTTVQLEDHKAHTITISSATVIKLPEALSSTSDIKTSRCFQILVYVPGATVPEGTKFAYEGLTFLTISDTAAEQDLTIAPGYTLFCFAEVARNKFVVQKIALDNYIPSGS